MEQLFLSILNMSIAATYVILIVILLRLLLRKSPRWLSYSLWFVVLFRLISPVSISSRWSLFNRYFRLSSHSNSMEFIPAEIGLMQVPEVNLGFSGINRLVNQQLPWSTGIASVNQTQIYLYILVGIWLAGVAALFLYSLITWIKFNKRTRNASEVLSRVYYSKHIQTPFVWGIFKPSIYLPANLSQSMKMHVIRHEEEHIRRLYHIFKPLFYFVAILHWFNPFVWVAFYLMNRDMEMSCDEKIIRNYSRDDIASYGETLVNLASNKPSFSVFQLAFGESSVKSRVKNLLRFKRPVVWVTAISLSLIMAISLLLLLNPKQPGENYISYMNNIKWFEPSVYATIDYDYNEEDSIVAESILHTAQEVFTYIGDQSEANQHVGALSRYYRFNQEYPTAEVDLDINLITAKINGNNGYLWIKYSVQRIDDEGNIIYGSWDILSHWKIESNNDGWYVSEIIESA